MQSACHMLREFDFMARVDGVKGFDMQKSFRIVSSWLDDVDTRIDSDDRKAMNS
jgi:hypothetical protein